MRGVSLYTLPKSAMTGFTKTLARDLGSGAITVNVVHPEPIDTDMNSPKPEKKNGAASLN